MTDETGKPATFLELIRRRQANEANSFYRHCDGCRQETRHVLVAETATQEIYACQDCGANKVYTVR